MFKADLGEMGIFGILSKKHKIKNKNIGIKMLFIKNPSQHVRCDDDVMQSVLIFGINGVHV